MNYNKNFDFDRKRYTFTVEFSKHCFITLSAILLCKGLIESSKLSILLRLLEKQILCFLLALKGITSGMIWDAATSAKGQMSIGREDLVLPRQQAGQGSRRRSFFSQLAGQEQASAEALMQHVYELYKRGLSLLVLLFNNES